MADTFSVLLVDDDIDTQSLFQDALDHYGIDLKVASDQPSTLKALSSYAPDVVVLDIFLQDTDGYKLLHAIRSLPKPVTCPIIATTGYYTTDTTDELERHGFDGYLLKPLDPEGIVEYLQGVVKKSN